MRSGSRRHLGHGPAVPPGPTAGDDFEARVQRVWEHMKGGYFTFEEHDRLREELGRLIAKEGTSAYQ